MKLEAEKARVENENKRAGITIDMNKAAAESGAVMEKVALDHSGNVSKATEKLVGAAEKLVTAAQAMTERATKKTKIKAPSGKTYEVD